ncbi:MAG: MFS transporter [Ktedonobacterales bacterium]
MNSQAQTLTRTDSDAESRQRLRVGLSFFAFILIGANDGAVGILLPSVIAHYSIDKATAGLLFIASTLGYLIAAFSSGLLLERLGRRNMLAFGAAGMIAGAAAFSTMPPFAALFPVLFCIGFGVAILDAGLNAYIAGLPSSTGLLNYLHAFYGIGALIGPLVASTILALAWGWNTTYLVWVAAGGVVLLGFLLLFQGDGRVSARKAGSGQTEAEGNILFVTLRTGLVWLAALFLLAYVGAEVSLGTWSYSLLTEDRHAAALISGWTVSGYWMGLTVGRLVLGRIAERAGAARLIQWCLVGVAVGVAVVWVAPNVAIAAVGLWVTGFSLGPIFPSTIAVISERVEGRLQQSAIGFAASLGSLGAAFFPWVAGTLAQRVGLWTLLPFVGMLAVVMFGLWVALQRTNQHAIANAAVTESREN